MARRKSTFGTFFSGTMGVVLGVLFVFVGIPIIVCMGCIAAGPAIRSGSSASINEGRAETRRHALEVLKPHGIVELEEKARIGSSGIFKREVQGKGKHEDGTLRQVVLVFRIAKFGSEERWEVSELKIDGKEP